VRLSPMLCCVAASCSRTTSRLVLPCLAAVSILVVSSSCTVPTRRFGAADVVDLQTVDGALIKDAFTNASKGVLLLFAPSDCLSCSADLHQWLELKETMSLVLLTKEPDIAERKLLKKMRVLFSVVAPGDRAQAQKVAPAILVIIHGQPVIAASRVIPPLRALLLDSARGLIAAQPSMHADAR